MTLLTAKEVAEMFLVSTSTIYKWEREGLIKADLRTPTNRRFYSEEQVKRLMKEGVDSCGSREN